MGTTEERIAAVEARVGEQAVMMDVIRQLVDRLDQRFTALEARLDHRFTALEAHLDQRFSAIDQRFSAIDQRFLAIDQRFGMVDQRFISLDDRFAALDAKMSRQFQFLVGIQVTMFVGLAALMLR